MNNSTAVSTSDAMSKLQNFFERLALPDNAKEMFMLLLEPLITEYLNYLLAGTLSQSQIQAISEECEQRNLDESVKALAIIKAYESKVGRSISEDVNQFVYKYIDSINKDLDVLNKIATKVANSKEEVDLRDELEKYLEHLVERDVRQVKPTDSSVNVSGL
jgi:hypothetical protein